MEPNELAAQRVEIEEEGRIKLNGWRAAAFKRLIKEAEKETTLGTSGRSPTKKLWMSSGESELIEDALHCNLYGLVMRVDRSWVVRTTH